MKFKNVKGDMKNKFMKKIKRLKYQKMRFIAIKNSTNQMRTDINQISRNLKNNCIV